MLFAYFGPETTLPFASVLATIVGFVLMFGRVTLRLIQVAARRVWRTIGPGPRKTAKHGSSPHLFDRRSRANRREAEPQTDGAASRDHAER